MMNPRLMDTLTPWERITCGIPTDTDMDWIQTMQETLETTLRNIGSLKAASPGVRTFDEWYAAVERAIALEHP